MSSLVLPPLIPGEWITFEGADARKLQQRYLDSLRLSFIRQFGEDGFQLTGGIRGMRLACYPRHLLCEIGLRIQEAPMVGAFLFGAEGVTILDGTSVPIHDLNDRISLDIGSREAALDYLRFFASAVHGEEGRFHFITVSFELAPYAQGDLSGIRPVLRAPSLSRNATGWSIGGIVRYGRNLFRSSFELRSNGLIEMVEDEPLEIGLPCGPDLFRHMCRGAPICGEGR